MIYIGNKEYIPYIGNKAVEYIYIGDKLYYSAIRTHTVTYYVDTNVTYSENVNDGDTCLSPTTFTPSKDGYRFVGWREDTTASNSVLNEKVVTGNNIVLYAVFAKDIMCTYYNNTTSAEYFAAPLYYNNGTVANAQFSIFPQFPKEGWNPRGWSTSTDADGDIIYENETFERDSDITLYGMYYKTIILSYSGNGNTGGSTASQTGTAYYNSNGETKNPSFTLRSNGFTKTNYSFTKWAMGSTSGTQYNAGASISLNANTTFYAMWTESS